MKRKYLLLAVVMLVIGVISTILLRLVGGDTGLLIWLSTSVAFGFFLGSIVVRDKKRHKIKRMAQAWHESHPGLSDESLPEHLKGKA